MSAGPIRVALAGLGRKLTQQEIRDLIAELGWTPNIEHLQA